MAAGEFLETQAALHPELEAEYFEFRKLFNRKLWHQLTVALVEFTGSPQNSKGQNFLELYEGFVTKFAHRLNQLELTRVTVAASSQLTPSTPPSATELQAGVEFLDKAREKRGEIGEEAWIVLSMESAALRMAGGGGGLTEGKELMEEAKGALEALASAAPLVHSTAYRVAAEYHKRVGPAEAFFTNALLFLSHTPQASLPPAVAADWAASLAMAALVGKDVFNFGEIVEHPILAALEGTPDAWLTDLLVAFQTGDIDSFNALVSDNTEAFHANAALQQGQQTMKEKLTLLCVMELAANLPASQRTIPFATIAEATRLGLEQVEWLLMRGISLGLIKATMDEVAQTVSITYVRPRVLHQPQIAALQGKVADWAARVKTTLVSVEEQTGELFT
ncbi:RPN9B [Symbiodinium sp. KB8]|nr:RPN9B [Symbiodinium sp. KB8]